ncbi:aldo/keto reductase [Achromobacter insuavis]
MDALVDAGLNFIDTADVYSRWAPGNQGGESEALIGKWLKRSGKRDQVLIATKVGMEMGPDAKGLAPAYIRRSLDARWRGCRPITSTCTSRTRTTPTPR